MGAAAGRQFGLYVHVPFCTVRCGYCDFNTYTRLDLGGGGALASFRANAVAEMELAAGVGGPSGRPASIPRRPLDTVFFGGGTPTLLAAEEIGAILAAARRLWGLAPGAEISVEANPDSVSQASVEALAEAGVTRLSLGVQSAVPHVLAALERTHRPDNAARAAGWALGAGLELSVDLIYGTPGESLDDWRASLEAALALGARHISAYALTLVDSTPMARRITAGDLPGIDEADQAAKYELADSLLSAAGFEWYEISNWAAGPERRCRHNLGYWRRQDWLGIGPGAHSGVGGKAPVRWWNVRHPARWAALLAAGALPIEAEDRLDAQAAALEQVMLALRLTEGLDLTQVPPSDANTVPQLIADGLLDPAPATRARARLTLRGRLLADTATLALAPTSSGGAG
jgi:oxygen-independent coproporphyrinogen-3 oxidase